MERREFLSTSAATVLTVGSERPSLAEDACGAPVFSTVNRRWQMAYQGGLHVLVGNVQTFPHIDVRVLSEGADGQLLASNKRSETVLARPIERCLWTSLLT